MGLKQGVWGAAQKSAMGIATDRRGRKHGCSFNGQPDGSRNPTEHRPLLQGRRVLVLRRNLGVMVSMERGQDQLFLMGRTLCRPTSMMIEDQMEAQSQCANSGCHPNHEQHQNKRPLTNGAWHRGIVSNPGRFVQTAFSRRVQTNLTAGRFPTAKGRNC